MSQLTVFLARLIGLFTLLLVGALLIRGSTMVEKAVSDGPVMLVYAIISLAIGLAMILGHNVWSGGVTPVVVTIVGWLILAKGLLLLFATSEALTRLFEHMQYGEHYALYLTPSLVIGLYLTWAGFTAPSSNAKIRKIGRLEWSSERIFRISSRRGRMAAREGETASGG
jgi:uncharacterized membrane protein